MSFFVVVSLGRVEVDRNIILHVPEEVSCNTEHSKLLSNYSALYGSFSQCRGPM